MSSLGKSALEQGIAKEDTGNRALSVFTEDESILPVFRAKLSDYFRSGYDRVRQRGYDRLRSFY